MVDYSKWDILDSGSDSESESNSSNNNTSQRAPSTASVAIKQTKTAAAAATSKKVKDAGRSQALLDQVESLRYHILLKKVLVMLSFMYMQAVWAKGCLSLVICDRHGLREKL